MLKIPTKIEYVINTLSKNGYEAYIVGGCVRDMLMGKTAHDFDVTTSALPSQVQALFEKTVPTGIKHGTVTVIIDKTPIEVTTFRTDGKYHDHRRPDSIKFVSSLREDIARRDFTVNAMAFNKDCGLVDYFGGKADLENRILRAVGNPQKRFDEDALRILRLFRFSSSLGFSIEENTLAAAIQKAELLNQISGERIFAELYRAVCGENVNVLSSLISSQGLIFLKITALPDFRVIKSLSANPDLAFFAFLYLSKADFPVALSHLKVSNKLKNYCESLLKLLEIPLPLTKAEIKKTLCFTSAEIFSDYLDFISALGENVLSVKKLLSGILETKEPYLTNHLKIDGNELKEMGLSGGKIGEALRYLQDKVIESPDINTPEKLRAEILKILP